MMPFERMNGHIKGYVRSRSHPDACITKGYLTEECISFCTSYLQSETPVGLPSYNRHLGRLAGWGHREGSRHLQVDFAGRLTDFDRANLVVLQHLEVVDHWLEEHKRIIRKKYRNLGRQRTEAEISGADSSATTAGGVDPADGPGQYGDNVGRLVPLLDREH